MSRLVFFAVIAAVVYWLLKSIGNQSSRDENMTERVEDTVRCAHCGVHFPKQESLIAGEKFYCCEAHRNEASEKTV